MDPVQWEAFAPLAQKMNLSQAGVQELVNFRAQEIQAQTDQWAATTSGWRDQWRSDPEIGGSRSAETLSHAQSAVRYINDPALKEFLGQGFGNHPALVRAFAKFGKAIAEPVVGTGSPPAAAGKPELHERMYGKKETTT